MGDDFLLLTQGAKDMMDFLQLICVQNLFLDFPKGQSRLLTDGLVDPPAVTGKLG